MGSRVRGAFNSPPHHPRSTIAAFFEVSNGPTAGPLGTTRKTAEAALVAAS